MDDALISFYGDDFTGSTDAMESLARSGVRTVLFTNPPTPEKLARHPGIRAFGVAGLTRSMPPGQLEQTLRPAFASLRQSGLPIVHYKVCSTFDSSPHVGSIGRVIDVGMDAFASRFVPLVVGAPSLGRYCVFGNLFARSGGESDPFRLDRHPSMSRHPTTPMDEADLRLHLAKQTSKSIGLFDILHVAAPAEQAEREFDRLLEAGPQVVLIDLLHENELATVGRLIARHARQDEPLFVVGSSGVESALSAYWQEAGVIPAAPPAFPAPGHTGPIVVVSGSCSPVTAGQIDWALGHGFAEAALDTPSLLGEDSSERAGRTAAEAAAKALGQGRSVVLHSGRGPQDPRVEAMRRAMAAHTDDDRSAAGEGHGTSRLIGSALGRILRSVLETSPAVRRVLVAGGDTSGQVARAVGIEAVEMIGELTRGSPLCRASAPGSPADGIEITFKGGQIGKVDFFGSVERGQM